MSAPDLSEPIREALVAEADITDSLPAYLGSFPVFTRRPVPDNTPFPCVVVSLDISLTDEDGINDFRPRVVRDVIVYHTNETPANFREAEAIAFAIWRLFHRQRQSITVPDWDVVAIEASVPTPAPVSSDSRVGSLVQVQAFLAAAR